MVTDIFWADFRKSVMLACVIIMIFEVLTEQEFELWFGTDTKKLFERYQPVLFFY